MELGGETKGRVFDVLRSMRKGHEKNRQKCARAQIVMKLNRWLLHPLIMAHFYYTTVSENILRFRGALRRCGRKLSRNPFPEDEKVEGRERMRASRSKVANNIRLVRNSIVINHVKLFILKLYDKGVQSSINNRCTFNKRGLVAEGR